MILLSLILRILSNPLANVFQKKLAGEYGSFFVNMITYGGLSCVLLPVILHTNFVILPPTTWIYGVLGGILGALGNAFLVKSLSLGDLSVLGPINSYKSVVAMLFGNVFLDEDIPLEKYLHYLQYVLSVLLYGGVILYLIRLKNDSRFLFLNEGIFYTGFLHLFSPHLKLL